jgi:hypothetical protein
MRIDSNLNLIVPVYAPKTHKIGEDGKPVLDAAGKPVEVRTITAYVHSIPLSEEMIDRYFVILGQTFSQIFTQGLGIAAGPNVAMRLLKRLAIIAGTWEGEDGVERVLVEDMRRSTMVIAPATSAPSGWAAIPLQVAVDRKLLDDEDRREVENTIAFFICVSAILPRDARQEMLEAAFGLGSARTLSSTASEFVASLPKSKETAPSGEKSPVAVPRANVAATAAPASHRVSVPH